MIFTLLNGDIEPRVQEVEISSSFQIPHFQMIGLPGPEVAEAKDRIRSAIEASGFEFPKRKIVVNLSPASIRKQGTGLDLAMALAVLLESDRIDGRELPKPDLRVFAWGELGLNGQVKGVGSPARALSAAKKSRADLILIAKSDEAIFKRTLTELFSESEFPPVMGIRQLAEAYPLLRGEVPFTEEAITDVEAKFPQTTQDRAQLLPIHPAVGRILEIAASGAHHFLLLGPKGVGKSQAMEWFLALQPKLDREILRTRTFLAEISGKKNLSVFRRVGTQSKPASLIGSFSNGLLRPGEFSLAHGGVLVADEFPEWHRDSREALREPLERKQVLLTRTDGSYELPCDFVFAGNGNLCPCGGVPNAPSESEQTPCRCHPNDRAKYLSRLSGPILDRIDLVALVVAPALAPTEPVSALSFEALLAGVQTARARLTQTWGTLPGKLRPDELEAILESRPHLKATLETVRFRSFRDRHKTLRVALTVAALRGLDEPTAEALLEARLLRVGADRALERN